MSESDTATTSSTDAGGDKRGRVLEEREEALHHIESIEVLADLLEAHVSDDYHPDTIQGAARMFKREAKALKSAVARLGTLRDRNPGVGQGPGAGGDVAVILWSGPQ